jgi:hypothetical protein
VKAALEELAELVAAAPFLKPFGFIVHVISYALVPPRAP